MILVKVKLLRAYARPPKRMTEGAAGFDLFACDSVLLSKTVLTGIAVEIPMGYVGLIQPRSSLVANGAVAATGVIDSDYRGEVSVQFTDFIPFPIRSGDRVAQLLIVATPCVLMVESESLSETTRGVHGFGSTGR